MTVFFITVLAVSLLVGLLSSDTTDELVARMLFTFVLSAIGGALVQSFLWLRAIHEATVGR